MSELGAFSLSLDAWRASARAFDLASPAFLAASKPACRMAVVSGLSVEDVEGRGGVSVEDMIGGCLEGVAGFVAGVLAKLSEDGPAGTFEGVAGADGGGLGPGSTLSLSSPYSFHSSTSSRSPTIMPILTKPGSFLFPALRPHSMRAFSSVATSKAWNWILFAFSMVSMRDVAVMIWEEPAVREV